MNPDRPGFSTGAATVGAGTFQVELGGNAFWGDGPGFYTLPVTLRFGLGTATELRLESDTLAIQGGAHGVSDLFAGIKWTLHRGQPLLGVMARVRLPTGSSAFRQDGLTPDLTLLLDVPIGDTWIIEPNVALALPRDPVGGDRLAQWSYATTVSANLTPRLQAFAEVASLGAGERGGRRQWLADVGLARGSQDVVVDLDIIVGLSPAGPDVGLTGGVSFRF